jgi:hypothetical protein
LVEEVPQLDEAVGGIVAGKGLVNILYHLISVSNVLPIQLVSKGRALELNELSNRHYL